MQQSLRGHALPENEQDARALRAQHALLFSSCLLCSRDLTAPDAASTPAGWRETQISGFCEPCFEAMMSESEGEGESENETNQGD